MTQVPLRAFGVLAILMFALFGQSLGAALFVCALIGLILFAAALFAHPQQLPVRVTATRTQRRSRFETAPSQRF